MNDYPQEGDGLLDCVIECRGAGRSLQLDAKEGGYTAEEISFLRSVYAQIGRVLRESVKTARAERSRRGIERSKEGRVRAVAYWNSPDVAATKASAIERGIPMLTDREAEAAHWITEGKSNSEMAVIMGISRKTVDKHVENLYKKADVESRFSLMSKIYSMSQAAVIMFMGVVC